MNALFTSGCNEDWIRETTGKSCFAHTRFTVEHQELAVLWYFVQQIVEDVCRLRDCD
jgi:hypothetical protein